MAEFEEFDLETLVEAKRHSQTAQYLSSPALPSKRAHNGGPWIPTGHCVARDGDFHKLKRMRFPRAYLSLLSFNYLAWFDKGDVIHEAFRGISVLPSDLHFASSAF